MPPLCAGPGEMEMGKSDTQPAQSCLDPGNYKRLRGVSVRCRDSAYAMRGNAKRCVPLEI